MGPRKKGQSGKRKYQECSGSSIQEPKICIIHHPQSKCDAFVYLSELKDSGDRIRYLQSVRELRLSMPPGSSSRMETVCEQIPTVILECHGYHRDCYQRFTNHLDRLKPTESMTIPSTSQGRQSRGSIDKVALFAKDCIFCNKEGRCAVKKAGSWTSESTQTFHSDAWKSIVEVAELKQDERLLLRIRGYDLFASEAHFHPSCRRKYIVEPQSWKSDNTQAVMYQKRLEQTHEDAFDKVCSRVHNEILEEERVLKVSDLHATYIESLKCTEFENPKHRFSKLKSKLESKFGTQIRFSQLPVQGKFECQIVYSKNMELEKAVQSAFILGSKDIMTESANVLRNVIVKAFEESDETRWPPSVESLETASDTIPIELQNFLKSVLFENSENLSISSNRIVDSISQDICRAATNGSWKLPKHVLLAMTLRHLYRSKQLTTLLNRFGHCESHAFTV